jgi:MHS family proline/betaine transporter-like MFS transporter
LGTTVEYYDFAIYGFMATFLAVNFFPAGDETAALLTTFGTFAVAFLVRLPGGIVFGHIGDRLGRKRALSITIIMMSGATALIGLAPSYATLGIWAAAVLIFCRCVQGFSAGGEYSGAVAFVAENAPRHQRGRHTSMVSVGTYIGTLLASVMALVLTALFPTEAIGQWLWRIPFLLSVPIGVIGFWIRSRLDDTPDFKALREEQAIESAPMREVLRNHKRLVLQLVGLNGTLTGGYYISTIYGSTYLQTVGDHSPSFAFASTSVALVVGGLMYPLSGHLGDRFGRRPVILTGSVAAALLGFPLFALMAYGGPVWALLGHVVLCAVIALIGGSSFVTFVELLRARIRYTGMALGLNLANMLFGGTAPFIAVLLISSTGYDLSPAAFYCFCAVITLVAAVSIPETSGKKLEL